MKRFRRMLFGLLLLALLAGGLLLGVTVVRSLSSTLPLRRPSTTTIVTQIQGLAQLVTVKYVMEKVVVVEDIKVYGASRVLLVAHGVVKAGVDLSQIKRGDIRISGRKVIVRLPLPAITDVYLDEDKTHVIEHSTGLLRHFDKDLQQSARLEGRDAVHRSALRHGILEDANTRAMQQLKVFFLQLGFEEIEFR